MKNLFLSICISLSFSIFSQGNLQFSQVKLVTSLETVPVGKVWKIEGVTFSSGIPGGDGNTWVAHNSIQINGVTTVVRSSVNVQWNGPAYETWQQTFPIWLPAGTTLATSTGVNYISVLEFNIAP